MNSFKFLEGSIKHKTGKLPAVTIFLEDIDEWLYKASFLPLPITLEHARQAGQLPLHHRDPFDRMLIAQSIQERMVLVSKDPLFEPYAIRTIW